MLDHLRAGEMGRLRSWTQNIRDSLRTDGRGLEYVFLGDVRGGAPSGMRLLQASNVNEALLVRNLDLPGQRLVEHDDFNYRIDFQSVYRPMEAREPIVEHLD